MGRTGRTGTVGLGEGTIDPPDVAAPGSAAKGAESAAAPPRPAGCLPQRARAIVAAAPPGDASPGLRPGRGSSYRRADSAGHAGRLYDGLAVEYGAERVFMDRSDIAPGTSFADVVGREATDSDVLLAVIGPRWLDALDPDGHRRLDAPDDVTGMPGTPFTVPGLNPGALDGRFRRVTFLEAREYCAWLYRTGRLYRVPTEAEWEKAVRGTDGRLYPWGELWDDGPAGEGDDGRGASPYGLLHAVGAGEWAWTHRRHEYPFTPTGFDDARWMAPVNAIEAAGVSVVRGGGRWDPASARCTARTFRRWAPTRPPTAHVRLALPASAVEAGG